MSAACLKCAADSKKVPLYRYLGAKEVSMPIHLGKCIGGGEHSRQKSTSIQEFLSIPITGSIKDAVSVNKKMHLKVKKLLNAKKLDYEGGWIKNISDGIMDSEVFFLYIWICHQSVEFGRFS